MTWITRWLFFCLWTHLVSADVTCYDGDDDSCSSLELDARIDDTDSNELYLLQRDFSLGLRAAGQHAASTNVANTEASMMLVQTAAKSRPRRAAEAVATEKSERKVPVPPNTASSPKNPSLTQAVDHLEEKVATRPTEKSKRTSKEEVPEVSKMDASDELDIKMVGSGLWQTALQLTQQGNGEHSRHDWDEEIWAKAAGLTKNAEGDLSAFVTATFINSLGIFCCVLLFILLRNWYPLIYQNNLQLNSAPLDTIPEGTWGWIHAAWSVTTEQVIENAGMDQAMLLGFTEFGMRITCLIGIPMFCLVGPINAAFGGQAAGADNFSFFSFGNIELGSNLYWLHAFVVWGVVFLVQASIYGAQKQFLKWRFQWLRDLPNPRANTVLVEGIPEGQQSDEALKIFFNQMFGDNHKVTSTYVVRSAPKLEEEWDKREAMKQSCAAARFKAMKADAVDADKVELVKLQDELSEQDRLVGEEQRKVRSKSFFPGPDGYYTSSGFVTFKEKSDALLALSMQLGEDVEQWEISLPPEPNSVLYRDLQQGSSSSQTLMVIGYLLTAGLYILYMPAVVGMTQIAESINMGKLQPLWEAFAPTAGLQVMVAFLPTFLIFIFRNFFTLKDDACAQQMLQNWYFFFQLVFVIMVTAVGGSVVDFHRALAKEPLEVSGLLGQTMPLATHFYMNYLVLQWSSHALELLRAANLSKWLFFRTMYDDETARQMAEPEDQDYYGIGSRSCRLTINLLISIVYGTLCPPMVILTFIEFLFCRVVYGYLLPFAENRKPDLGGVFWVQQLRHVFVGNIIYCLVMTGVLFGRAANRGPGFIALSSLVYIVWSMRRFDTAFSWQKLPFKQLMDPAESTQNWISLLSKNRPISGEYVQPFMK